MEGNEIEKEAIERSTRDTDTGFYMRFAQKNLFILAFKAGANWQKERENAELTRANARIEELEKEKAEFRTAFIEYRDEAINLRKKIDLYRKANGQ